MPQSIGMQLLDLKIVELERPDPSDEYLLGTCYILGVPHHAEFIRVETTNRTQTAYSDGSEHRIEALQQYDQEARVFYTVKVPEQEGDWLVVITPFSI